MSLAIIRHPYAVEDLLAIYVYIGERNPDAARRLLSAVDDALYRLAELPGLGVECRFSNPKLAGLRRWVISGFRNYLIFYRATSTELQFLRLVHGARDLERVLSERQ